MQFLFCPNGTEGAKAWTTAVARRLKISRTRPMLAAGTCVLTSDASPLLGLTKHGCSRYCKTTGQKYTNAESNATLRLPTVITDENGEPDESRRFTYNSRTRKGTHAPDRQEFCHNCGCGNVGPDFPFWTGALRAAAVRRGDSARAHYRRDGFAVVFGGRGDSRRTYCGNWRPGQCANETKDRRAGEGRRAGIYRHAGTVGADDPRRSATAVEDLPGHHDGDYGRGQFRRSGERRNACVGPRWICPPAHHAGLEDAAGVFCAT